MKSSITLLALACAGAAFALGLEAVMPLPGGTNQASVVGLSADGSTVYGNSPGANGFEAFRWQASTGTVGLGDFAGGGFSSFAQGSNATGSKIVGRGTPDITRGFIWSEPGPLVRLANLSGGTSNSDTANAMSADGVHTVGQSNSLAYGIRATIWSGNALGQVLPDMAGGSVFNDALAVNADGTVVAGWGTSAAGFEAAIWTNGVLQTLGDLPGGTVTARATAINSDGTVVYGRGNAASSNTTFRWTAATGMVQLEPDGVAQLGFNSEPFACNAAGTVAVMRVQNRAALHIQGGGTAFLDDLLTAEGLANSAFTLIDAKGISADGLTVAGNAFVSGVIAGYRATFRTTSSLGSFHGTVQLEDFNLPEEGQMITVEVVDSAGNVVESGVTALRAGGDFGWSSKRTGSHTIRLKGSHWLSNSATVHLSPSTNVALGTVSLMNGDVNNDNEVGPGDFSLLSLAFGSFAGDANYNLQADLNGDGEVGPSDFSILASNFAEFGS